MFGDLSTPEAQTEVRATLGGRDLKEVLAAGTVYVRDAATIVNQLVNTPAKG